MSNPAETCPECGAPRVDGLDCWGQLGGILAWEAHDPELVQEHFLTVATWNLQHPAQFTDDALMGLRQAYVEHLDHGLPVAKIRKRMRYLAEGSTRVMKPAEQRRAVPRTWTMTVADVYTPAEPAGAAARVRAWAAATRKQLGA